MPSLHEENQCLGSARFARLILLALIFATMLCKASASGAPLPEPQQPAAGASAATSAGNVNTGVGGTVTDSSGAVVLGAAVTVPRCSWMAHSQRSGRERKASGDITVSGAPAYIGHSQAPMSPMSW